MSKYTPEERIIRSAMARTHIRTIPELADRTGIAYPSLIRKIKQPSTFTLANIRALDRHVRFSSEELTELIRGIA